MLQDLTIRPATSADAADIARIYNHYVETSTATFDNEPKTVDDRVVWIEGRRAEHPVFVAERGARVVGWGSLSPYRERWGWRHTAEVGVYVDSETTGGGVGPRITEALIESARVSGIHALISQIVADNGPSLKMAERAGFVRAGTLREVGRKFDRWLDLAIMELVLDDPLHESTP